MCWINGQRFAWNKKVPEEGYYRWDNHLWNQSVWPDLEQAKKIQSSKMSQRKSKSRAQTILRKWQETPTHLGFYCQWPRGHFILETFSLGLISILREQNWGRKRGMRFASPRPRKMACRPDLLNMAPLLKHSQRGTLEHFRADRRLLNEKDLRCTALGINTSQWAMLVR